MRKLFLICFIAFGNLLFSQEIIEDQSENLNWQPNFDLAQQIVKSQKKKLLIYFTGSDWCGPCKMLDADFFDSDRFKQIAIKEFVLYKADSPRNRDLVTDTQNNNNNKLKLKYNVSSYPTIVIIDTKGRFLGKFKGYNLMRETVYHFDFIASVME